MTDPEPHAYQCACVQCRSMAAAIGATNYDGSSFFTDAELFRLSIQNNARCDCRHCAELRAHIAHPRINAEDGVRS